MFSAATGVTAVCSVYSVYPTVQEPTEAPSAAVLVTADLVPGVPVQRMT